VTPVRASLLVTFIATVLAYAEAPKVDPRHFDTSSTNRADCDFFGCPPAWKRLDHILNQGPESAS
jgi:hypothetical protein